jgi:pyruvate kinase
MVARGDLGMEIPPEKVFLAQKIMIAKCNAMGKPVITATQMLESMGAAPRPTRAEAGDVANAVLDGTDAVMLSGETAGGMFPVEAVTVMRKIVEECEGALDYNAIYVKTRLNTISNAGTMSTPETVCSSSVKAALDVESPAIVVLTKTGAAGRYICKYRPQASILMGSTQDQVIRQSNIMRGVKGFKTTAGKSVDERIDEVIDQGTKLGLIKPGSPVVAVHGKDGDSNMVKMIQVAGDLPATRPSQTEVTTIRQGEMILPKDMVHLPLEESTVDSFKRKCKIICTMGPSCWDTDKLVQMIDSGLNVARLNFSHGDHAAHAATVGRIREADKLRPDKPIAIALDTKGPEIRTGFFAAPNEGGKINLTAGQDLKLVVDYSFKGDNTSFAVTYERLPQVVVPGNTILMADGSLVLKVKSCGSDHVICEVMNTCSIGERKNCNLPGVKIDLPILQDKDIKDLKEFAIPQKVHMVFASFVQSAADVKTIRETLGPEGKDIKIFPKIENQEGLNNFDEIVQAADGIMVARGDLGMEIPPEKVFLAQKIMIAKCNLYGKPVITATQMLESMGKAPRPTRAEAGDVANAVLDGTDCVMLSGETAGGDFPLEAVTIMRRIVEEAEAALDYGSVYLNIRETVRVHLGTVSIEENMAMTAAKNSLDSGAPAIVVCTKSGVTARLVAKYRPLAAIIAVTDDEYTARFLQTSRGIIGCIAPMDGDAETVILPTAIKHAQKIGVKGMISGAPVVLLAEERGRVFVKMIKIP